MRLREFGFEFGGCGALDLLLHIVSRGCLGVDIAICRLRGLSLIADFRLWGVGYEVAEFTAAGG